MNDNCMSVFIGRMRPYTLAHESIVRTALSSTSRLTILVGSCGEARSFRNPFTFDEVKRMILLSLSDTERERVTILPTFDMYSDTLWMKQIQEKVSESLALNSMNASSRVVLVGHAKDHTSYYLKLFTQWATDSINVPAWKHKATPHFPESDFFSATDFRNLYFSDDFVGAPTTESFYLDFQAVLPSSTIDFLDNFQFSSEYNNLLEEYRFVKKYRKQFESLPYPPIFVTTDAVVVKSGHVLLVKRKASPGKGLWALPGGFVDANERIDDSWVRELCDETLIDHRDYGRVHKSVLRGSLVGKEVFDSPNRDPRGRFITHAHLVKLQDGSLPKVKGGDDAELAKWMPLAEVKRDTLYADHFSIIETMVAKLNS